MTDDERRKRESALLILLVGLTQDAHLRLDRAARAILALRLAAGISNPEDVAAAFERYLPEILAGIQDEAATAGLDSLHGEVAGLYPVAPMRSGESIRARTLVGAFIARWLVDAGKRASPDGSITKSAMRAALEVRRPQLKTLAISEASHAFNESRLHAMVSAQERASLLGKNLEVLRRWDATLDEHTCPACAAMDGTVVGLDESFAEGEPGDVHPNCRCVVHYFTREARAVA